MFDPKLQETFDRMFSVGKTNEERRSDYYANSCRSWILTYEIYGVEMFTSGQSPEDCVKRTNEKHGDKWIFNNVMQQSEWFKEGEAMIK